MNAHPASSAMRSLADFKRLCTPGAQFMRHIYSTDCDGNPVKDRVCTVAKLQTRDVIFLAPNVEPTPENIAACAARAGALGSWCALPPASRVRIEGNTITFADKLGRDVISFTPMDAS